MSGQTPILETDGLIKDFGGLRAVNQVSISVHSGEILGLIGPNGAGKTTLFNLIAGFYRASGGSIRFRQQETTKLPPYKICRKGIARTFQQLQTFTGLTVRENIITADIFGGSRRGRNVGRDVDGIMDFVGLAGKQDQLVDNLTAFDQKRVEIGKALACRPELLLLDEIGAGLNDAEHELVKALILKINRELAITIVLIEHIMETIMDLSHRLVVLNNGEVLTTGEPATISKDPRVIEAYLGKEYIHRAQS